jgi:GWxTD domain-containing protein
MRQDSKHPIAASRTAHPILRLAAAIVLVAGAGIARAQQSAPHAAADSLLQIALAHVRAGDTVFALKVLETAEKIAPDFAPAYYQRGVLISRATRLGMSDILRRREASKQINRALDLDQNNPFYLMELGRIRLKTPFLRLDAERLFKRALRAAEERHDPAVLSEIDWELGQIHERRYLTMANRRMITSSAATFDPDAAVNDWHYTKDFLAQQTQKISDAGEIDYRQAENFYRAALTADTSNARAATSLLVLLFDVGRFEEVAHVARDLVRALPREPRLRFAQGLALHRLDRDADASAVFDTAFALVPPDDRHAMMSLEHLLRRDDARSYAALSDGGREAMDSLYWDVADPLRLTPVNEAKVEFLARVAYADLRWSSEEFRTRGWQTDRGIVYIRYGPPPEVATFSPETAEIESSDAMGRVTTVWFYPETKLRFVFVGPPAMNYALFAGDFRAYADNARFLTPASFDNLSTKAQLDTIPVQIARFRGEDAAVSDVAIYADIPTTRILKTVDVTQSMFETAFFLTDGRRRTLVNAQDSALVRIDQKDEVTTRSWRRELAPGDYLYRVEARQPASGRGARGLASFSVATFPKGEFTVSDLLVARRLSPRTPGVTPRQRADFFITPNASLTVSTRDTVFLYWENYGATADSAGNAHLRVELALRLTDVDRGTQWTAKVLGGLVDAVGLSAKGDERVSLRFDRKIALDPSDRIPNYLALDLGDAPGGTYALELTVTDLVSGRLTTRSRTIHVPRS